MCACAYMCVYVCMCVCFQKHSLAEVTLIYLGKSLTLGGPVDNRPREVVVLQQHCGGNTVCLYSGHLVAKGTVQVINKIL